MSVIHGYAKGSRTVRWRWFLFDKKRGLWFLRDHKRGGVLLPLLVWPPSYYLGSLKTWWRSSAK